MFNEFAHSLVDGNHQLGYWVTDGKPFYNKLRAVEHASKYNTEVEFIFNDSVFTGVNWGAEPTLSLADLYSMRAAQLRAKYDYVAICYSGGSDSSTVLASFLKAGVPFDDLISYGPFSHIGKQSLAVVETDTATPDMIKYVLANTSARHTRLDLTVDFFTKFDSPEWVYESDTRFAPDNVYRDKIYAIPHLVKLANEGKKVCLIFGMDKPPIRIENDKWVASFWDLESTNVPPCHGPDFNGIAIEPFYWSPDLPELLVKMCHVGIRHLEANFPKEEIATKLSVGPTCDYEWFHAEMCTATTIYWSPDTFTIGKSHTGLMFLQRDGWFWKHPEKFPGQYDKWEDGISMIPKIVAPKFLQLTQHYRGKLFNLLRRISTKSYLICDFKKEK